MTFTAFFLIVLSATLHAAWNLLAKKNRLTLSFYLLMSMMATLMWLHVQFWTPVHMTELPVKFWGFLALSIASDWLYCWGLIRTYRKMEMSAAYPVMRALPILLTTLLIGCLGWGTPLGAAAKVGILVVFAGCLLMPLRRLSELRVGNYLNSGMLFIFLTACGTTGYTVFDSRAQRAMAEAAAEVSGPILSMTYYSTRSITLSTSLLLVVVLTAKHRATLKEYWRKRERTALLAGVFASCTYILVLLAMNYVSNVSYVQVFRQLGLPIGMAAGIFFLGERGAKIRYAGVILILAGLLLSILK